jgi:2-(1,2-epoxy-1,2-dihydrophenyl)acetyl-CoA isomerase
MVTKSLEAVKLSIDGHVAIITLNRPERLNAVSADLREGLHSALNEVAASDEVRAVILTGEGRGFCSGADVKDMRTRYLEDPEALRARQEQEAQKGMKRYPDQRLPVHIRSIPQPVIAAVNGVASGMGLSIALSCDIRVASEQARFASIFIKRSIMPDNGATYFLPRLAGLGVAGEMALTGNVYDASWALEKGLVNKVVPHESLMEEARAYADTIAGNPPLGVRMTKFLIQRGVDSDLQQALDNEGYYNSLTQQTSDRKEAVLAFVEKRAPQFKGS